MQPKLEAQGDRRHLLCLGGHALGLPALGALKRRGQPGGRPSSRANARSTSAAIACSKWARTVSAATGRRAERTAFLTAATDFKTIAILRWQPKVAQEIAVETPAELL